MKSSNNFRYLSSRRIKPAELHTVYKKLHAFFGHQHWWPGDTPFEIIIGAILTQNTAWTNVEKAISNLKRARMLSPQAMKSVSHRKLASLVRPAGYFNVKAVRLKSFIEFLYQEYRGNLKKMFRERGAVLRDKLLRVKGIGPETADSICLYAAGKRFFVMDAYTKRVFGRHGLMNPDRSYDEWRDLFESSLPKNRSLYNDFHAQIVNLGKYYCKTHPVCESCPLKSYL